jgi:PmbA protein
VIAMPQQSLDFVSNLIAIAKKAGADGADAGMFESASTSVAVRLGKTEHIERNESKGFGLRVMVGKKQAIVSSTDTSADAVNMLVERAVSMAKASPDDPYIALAGSELLARDLPDLDLYDANEPAAEWLIESARSAEEAALAVKGISNSEGGDASYSIHKMALATTNGFAQAARSSNCGISVCVLAGSGTGMERDYDYSSARFISDLAAPELIGKNAAELTLKRLQPRKIASNVLPTVFDKRVSKSLVSAFASAINGAAVARGTSFLKECMNQPVFGKHISIIDDPYRLRGLGSRQFDGEGVAGKKRALVDHGTLTGWMLDMRSANQLGMVTSGNAVRGLSSPPSPSSSNLYMENGTLSMQELLKDIKAGFYITDLFGMGVNIITGDYSQGASGFWIENGEIAYPVSEVTIAGNLADMFQQLTPANDLEFRYSTNAPTVRIDKMTIAGV